MSAGLKDKVEVGLRDAEHFVFAGRCESVRLVARLVPNGFCSDPGWERGPRHPLRRQTAMEAFPKLIVPATCENQLSLF